MRFTDLPRDLESEILSRVPAKSLQKLKPTCKRWYALFRDPKFLEKHVAKASREFLALLDSKFQTISVNLGNSSVDSSIELTGILNIRKDQKDVMISDVFQCEGLLLCLTNDMRLVAWNPYTGQTRWIPYKHKVYHKKCFLGYENNNNKSWDSFKILSYFHCYDCIPVDELEIYEFKSDSWRSLDDKGVPSLVSDGVTLKGNVYWFAADYKDHVDQFILRFDFTTEKFGRLSLPFERGNFDDAEGNVVLSVIREEKLALLYLDFNSVEMMKIWVTNTKTDEAKNLSWSNFLVVNLGKFMVTVATNVFSFSFDEEKKMVMLCDGAYVNKYYIVGEQVYKEVFEKTWTMKASSYPRLVSYAPSLVQIQQGKVNPGGKRKK